MIMTKLAAAVVASLLPLLRQACCHLCDKVSGTCCHYDKLSAAIMTSFLLPLWSAFCRQIVALSATIVANSLPPSWQAVTWIKTHSTYYYLRLEC